MIQGVKINGRIRTSTSTGSMSCSNLFLATTLVLDELPGQPDFVEENGFTFVWNGSPVSQFEIPAGGAPPPPPFSVQVIVTGCNPCKVGDFAERHLRVTNPGPPRTVEVKAGSHFPHGGTFVFLGRYVEMEVPSGVSAIAIPGIALPAGLPFGTYTIEGALLEPDFGTTLSRHSVTGALNP